MKPVNDAIAELHDALEEQGIAHAFGGALALAWCTGDPRATSDVDINIFHTVIDVARVLAALPSGIQFDEHDVMILQRDGQQRLLWDETPIDLFFSTTSFHDAASSRCVVHRFLDRDIPFLSCTDLAVFKAFCNRPKDWIDLAGMAAGKAGDLEAALGAVVRYLGTDDERAGRLRELLVSPVEDAPTPNLRDIINSQDRT
jgi:hypothetical protein